MWEFLGFWRGCLFEGWHIGEGAFAWIEGLCFLIWAGTLWLKKTHRLRKEWENYEEKIMKCAFLIFAIAFLISTLFVAPYIQYRDAKKGVKISEHSSEFKQRALVLADQLVQFSSQWPTNKEDQRIKYDELRDDYADRIEFAFRGFRDRGLAIDRTWISRLMEIESGLLNPSINRIDVKEEIHTMARDIKKIAGEVTE